MKCIEYLKYTVWHLFLLLLVDYYATINVENYCGLTLSCEYSIGTGGLVRGRAAPTCRPG